MTEQKEKLEHVTLQHDDLAIRYREVEQDVMEVCSTVLDLEIPVDLPPATKIQHMVVGFRTAQAEVTRAQEELKLQVLELHLKARQLTPLAKRERRCGEILAGLETMQSAIREFSELLCQSLGILTSLQEDPAI